MTYALLLVPVMATQHSGHSGSWVMTLNRELASPARVGSLDWAPPSEKLFKFMFGPTAQADTARQLATAARISLVFIPITSQCTGSVLVDARRARGNAGYRRG